MINSREVFEIARNKGLEVAEGLLLLFGPNGYDDSNGISYDNTMEVLKMAKQYGWDDDEPEYQTDEPGYQKFYGPLNPWDAPGMSVSDFI